MAESLSQVKGRKSIEGGMVAVDMMVFCHPEKNHLALKEGEKGDKE